MKRMIGGTAVALLLAALPVAAQAQHAHRAHGMQPGGPGGRAMMQAGGGMMGGGMMGGGMMSMMGQGMGAGMGIGHGVPGPAALLEMRDALELTPEQVTRLEAIRKTTDGAVRKMRQQAQEAATRASKLRAATSPDPDAYAAAIREAGAPLVEAHALTARTALQARQLLTAEQQKTLAAGTQAGVAMCRAMMGGMGGGMTGGGAAAMHQATPSGAARSTLD